MLLLRMSVRPSSVKPIRLIWSDGIVVRLGPAGQEFCRDYLVQIQASFTILLLDV